MPFCFVPLPRNAALYYFSDIELSSAIAKLYATRLHYIDPYPAQSSTWESKTSASRLIWSHLELNPFTDISSILRFMFPYLSTIRLNAFQHLYHQTDSVVSRLDQALAMAQRTSLSNLSITQLIAYSKRTIRFWKCYLAFFEVELLVSTILPHSFTDFLLLDACKQQNISAICPTATGLSRSCQYLDYTTQTFLARPPSSHVGVDSVINQDLHSFVTANLPGSPSLSGGYAGEFKELSVRRTSHYKRFLLSQTETALAILEYKTSLARHYDFLCRLRPYTEAVKAYQSIHALFLQYQPESSTLPQGNSFFDQLSLVDKIASEMPDNSLLLVKEHPNQFLRTGIDHAIHPQHLQSLLAFRSTSDYDYILSKPNCCFYPRSLSATSLLNLPLAKVWNVAGTISLQSLLSGHSLGLLDVASIYQLLPASNSSQTPDDALTLMVNELSSFTWPRFRRDSEIIISSETCGELLLFFFSNI